MLLLAAGDPGLTAADALTRTAQVALILLLAVTVVAAARRGVPRAVARVASASADPTRAAGRTRTLSGLLVSVIRGVVYGLAGITALGLVGIPLGPLIASAGVVGLAVGFGAQQLVRDVIGGFFVLVEDQYAVGDHVTAGGVTGTVEELTIRVTKVRADDGVLHHVRNGDLGVVSNASRGYGVVTVTVPVPADTAPDDAVDRITRAMAAIVERGDEDMSLLADPVVLGVTSYRDDGSPLVTVTARTTPDARAHVQRVLVRETYAAVRTPAPRAKPAARRKR